VPREIRMIIFDRDEIATALLEFMTGSNEIGECDELSVAAISEHGTTAVEASIGRGAERSTRAVTGSRLAAAMIMYCIRRRIPLPHKTDKFLKPVASGLALSFTHGIGADDFDLVLRDQAA
jgi:hypothetical protein